MRKGGFEVTFDRDFTGVMRGCAARDSTWIGELFHRVYGELHAAGKAHSAEVWVEGALAGGIYGVHLGGAFFAESMFHRATDMSKVALVSLAARLFERGFTLLEVQYLTPHLSRFGAVEISHQEYMRRLQAALALERTF
jgi:leucyl/phenylalanyl-tRNA--protein transferase